MYISWKYGHKMLFLGYATFNFGGRGTFYVFQGVRSYFLKSLLKIQLTVGECQSHIQVTRCAGPFYLEIGSGYCEG